MLAPFWTDLDGSAAPGILVGILTDGVNNWIVVEWRVNDWGTNQLRTFQVWIGINGVQDITYAYAAAPIAPAGQDFAYGAENEAGAGDVIVNTLPPADQTVMSTDPAPGDSVTYSLILKGKPYGAGKLVSSMKANGVLGTTIVKTNLTVIH